MATWVEKSFALVAKGGYVDRLAQIYPPPPPARRELSPSQYQKIKSAFSWNDVALLKLFLSFEKFPFNDPYISFLRQQPEEIERSPQTVKRICDRLREMGVNGAIQGITEPK